MRNWYDDEEEAGSPLSTFGSAATVSPSLDEDMGFASALPPSAPIVPTSVPLRSGLPPIRPSVSSMATMPPPEPATAWWDQPQVPASSSAWAPSAGGEPATAAELIPSDEWASEAIPDRIPGLAARNYIQAVNQLLENQSENRIARGGLDRYLERLNANSEGVTPKELQAQYAEWKANQPEPEMPIASFGDVASAAKGFVTALPTTGKEAFYRMKEQLAGHRPDEYSPAAREAFADSLALQQRQEEEQQQREREGTATHIGEAIRLATPSSGFSLGSMAAATATGLAGRLAGAKLGALAGAPAGPIGAGLGALAGGFLGGYGAANLMSKNQFMEESFREAEAKMQQKEKRALTEPEKQQLAQELEPIADSYARHEALPEALGNMAMLVGGGVATGLLGRETLKQLPKMAFRRALVRAGAGAAAVGSEFATETITELGQALDNARRDALLEGRPITEAKSRYEGQSLWGLPAAFETIAKPTLGTLLMFGLGGTATKGATNLHERLVQNPQEAQAIIELAEKPETLAAMPESSLKNLSVLTESLGKQWFQGAGRREKLEQARGNIEAELSERAVEDSGTSKIRQETLRGLWADMAPQEKSWVLDFLEMSKPGLTGWETKQGEPTGAIDVMALRAIADTLGVKGNQFFVLKRAAEQARAAAAAAAAASSANQPTTGTSAPAPVPGTPAPVPGAPIQPIAPIGLTGGPEDALAILRAKNSEIATQFGLLDQNAFAAMHPEAQKALRARIVALPDALRPQTHPALVTPVPTPEIQETPAPAPAPIETTAQEPTFPTEIPPYLGDLDSGVPTVPTLIRPPAPPPTVEVGGTPTEVTTPGTQSILAARLQQLAEASAPTEAPGSPPSIPTPLPSEAPNAQEVQAQTPSALSEPELSVPSVPSSTPIPTPIPEVPNAQSIPEAGPLDGGRSTQPPIRPEGGRSPEGGPGVQPGGPGQQTLETGSEGPAQGLAPGLAPSVPPAPPAPGTRPLQRHVLYTPNQQTQVEADFEVVDLSQLITSDDPRFPAELQPRNRDRQASALQIRKIATKLNPELLTDSKFTSHGAPLVGRDDNLVEAGNGRVMALAEVYANPELRAQADAYRRMLVEQGFDLRGISYPVLVRRRQTPLDATQRVRFVQESNESTTPRMAASERAKVQAQRLLTNPGLLSTLRGGELNSDLNAPFVRRFLAEVVSPDEVASLQTADLKLNKDGLDEIRNTILAAAYSDPDLISLLTEEQDTNIKTIGNVLQTIAPDLLHVKAYLNQYPSLQAFDLSDSIVAAVRLIHQSRAEKRPLGLIVNNRPLFDPIDPTVERILRLFFSDTELTRSLSQEKLTKVFRAYTEEALKLRPESILLPDLAPIALNDLMAKIEERHREGLKKPTPDLLARPPVGPVGPEGGETNQRPGLAREGTPAGTPGPGETATSAEKPGEPTVAPSPTATRPDEKKALARTQLADRFQAGEALSIAEARKVVYRVMDLDSNQAINKKIAEEVIEQAVVQAARAIVQENLAQNNPVLIYQRLYNLYYNQPNLKTRTSESIEDQAYSTPIPLAYLVSHLAGVGLDANAVIVEPTAGNGALLIAANPDQVLANEKNQTRANFLKQQGFTTSTADATRWKPKQPADILLANPPFGTVVKENQTQTWSVPSGISESGRYETSHIDHAIVLQQLANLKDDGVAVLIIGGVKGDPSAEASRRAQYQQKGKAEFYWTLVNDYNVVDHFAVAGALYGRQGATFPVDVIVIHGRRTPAVAQSVPARALPGVNLPIVYESWEQLTEVIRNERGNPAWNPALFKGQFAGLYQPSRGHAPGTDRSGPGARVPGLPGDVGSTPGTAGSVSEPTAPGGVRPDSGIRNGGENVLPPTAPAPTRVPRRPADDGRVNGRTDRNRAVDSGADTVTPTPEPTAETPPGKAIVDALFNKLTAEEAAAREQAKREQAKREQAKAQAQKNQPKAPTEPAAPSKTTENAPSQPQAPEPTAETPPGEVDYEAMFEESLAKAVAKRKQAKAQAQKTQPKAPAASQPEAVETPPAPRTIGEAARSAVTETAQGLDAILDAAYALLGGSSKLSSGLTFDEETYEKFKPIFKKAVAHFKTAAKDIKEVMDLLIEALLEKFDDAQIVSNMKPFAARFIKDVVTGKISMEDEVAPSAKTEETQSVSSEFQTVYVPKSKAASLGTLVPVNMQAAAQKALENLEKEVGPIDAFVANELGYQENELGRYFGGEQVDAIGLAIFNLKQSRGYITADQTGIGKGRVNAAIIRWAIRNGKTPIFVTEKPNLYRDMIRDLRNIGFAKGKTESEQLQDLSNRILMTNSSESIPLDEDALNWEDEKEAAKLLKINAPTKYGLFLETKTSQVHGQILQSIVNSGVLPESKQIIFTTYDQLNPRDGKRDIRHDVIDLIAKNGIVLLDESHNAGGSGLQKANVFNRSGYFRNLVDLSDGTFYSSATFAKRPDVMDLYRRTDMSLAVGNIDMLPVAIQLGGIPMQQVVSTMLVESGQLQRRERTFEGVAYEAVPIPMDRQIAENQAVAMRKILEFSRSMTEVVKTIKFDLAHSAGSAALQQGANLGSVTQTTFASIMHNLISQFLLAMKAQQAVDVALTALRNGEKPVLTFSNTMESLLSEYVEANNIQLGDPVDLSFGTLLERYLNKSRTITITKPFAKTAEKPRLATDAELTPEALRLYNEALQEIKKHDWSTLPSSPIDYIKYQLEKAGYRTGEITGRRMVLDYGGTATMPVYAIRPANEANVVGRIRAINKFNNGQIDVMLLNRAGSTGLSLHASPEAGSDTRQRHMIIVQPEGNIDTHMQLLGRIHRTGQVVPPKYSQLVGNIPAEVRPASVLAKKMASLNANTTGARSSAVTAKEALDIMNVYGDEAVAAVLFANLTMHQNMGNPLKINSHGDGFITEGAAAKATGYLPMLSVGEQEEFYRQVDEEFKAIVELAKSMGENKLEAQTLDLDAEAKESLVIFDGQPGEISPFASEARATLYDIKRQGRSMTQQEIDEDLARYAGVKDAKANNALRRKNAEILQQVDNDARAYLKALPEDAQEGIENRMRAATNKILDVFNSVPPGTAVSVTSGTGNVFYGIVTGIEHKSSVDRKGNPSNPTALSTWAIKVAAADPVRIIKLPFSRIDVKESKEPTGRTLVLAEDPKAVQDRFALQEGTSREDRVILEGNLLAAYAQFPQGQIAYFRKRDGTLQQGIILPRIFNMDDVINKSVVPLQNATAAEQFLEAFQPDRYLSAQNNEVQIRYAPDAHLFTISVPKAKAKGSRWFTNRALLSLVEHKSFVSSGRNMMVADIHPRNLHSALTVIYRDIESPLNAVDLSKNKPRRSLPSSSRLAEASEPLTIPQARAQLVEIYGETLVSAMEKSGLVQWHETDPTGSGGQAFVHQSAIHLVPSNMTGRDALSVALHESMHLAKDDRFNESNRAILQISHAVLSLSGLRNFVGNPGFQDLTEQVQRLAREGNATAIAALEHAQRVDPNNAAEESVAYLVEYADPNLPLVRRVLSAIRAVLYRLGVKIALRPEDVRQLALSALKQRAKRALRQQQLLERMRDLEHAFFFKHGTAALQDLHVNVLEQLSQDPTYQEFHWALVKELERRYSLANPARSATEALQALRESRFVSDQTALNLLGQFPDYLREVGAFIAEQRQKLLQGRLTPREVAKAYLITQSSIGSDARSLPALEPAFAKVGLKTADVSPLFLNEKGGLRPEELMAWWLGTPTGQRALDALEAGRVDTAAFQEFNTLREPYGRNPLLGNSVLGLNQSGGFSWGVAPEPRTKAFNLANLAALTGAINATQGDPKALDNVLGRINGIGAGKTGFIGHLLGMGNRPTVDAVELNFWLTGQAAPTLTTLPQKTARTLQLLRTRLGDSRVSQALFERVNRRITALSTRLADQYQLPRGVMPHLLHHWLWDKAKGIQTPHAGLYEAMRRYSLAPEATGIEVGEASMEEFEAIRALFQAKQAKTPFQQWFGQGTVGITVQPNGTPITLYHGTNNPHYTEWDASRAGLASGHPTSGLGFFMTADRRSAARYGSHLLELYAKIDNPYYLTDGDLTTIETTEDATRLRAKLKAKGYDGAVVTAPGGYPYVIAFDPHQIKLTSNTAPTASPDMRYSKAWHGTPHEVDKFDYSKIGTGEGAQVFGYGLYFTQTRGIADYYKKKLVKVSDPLFNYQSKLDEMVDDGVIEDYDFELAKSIPFKAWLRETGGASSIAMEDAYDPNSKITDAALKALGNRQIRLDKLIYDYLRGAKINQKINSGHVYEVDLSPNEDEYLLWDKPFSQQSDKVKAALLKINQDTHRDLTVGYDNDLSGENIYRSLTGLLDTDRENAIKIVQAAGIDTSNEWYHMDYVVDNEEKIVSAYLYSLGIKGNKFLDQLSRKMGEGTYNYVIFDDRDIKIVARYSRPNPNPPTPANARQFLDDLTGMANPQDAQPNILRRLWNDPSAWKETLGKAAGALTTRTRPAWLRLLSRQMMVEMLESSPIAQSAKLFEDTARLLDSDKQQGKQKAFELADRLQREVAKSRDMGRQLYRLWYFTTLNHVDPTKPAPTRDQFVDQAHYLSALQNYDQALKLYQELQRGQPEMARLYSEILQEIQDSFDAYHVALRDRLGRGANGIFTALLDRAKDILPRSAAPTTLTQRLAKLAADDETAYDRFVEVVRERLATPAMAADRVQTLRDTLPDDLQKTLFDDVVRNVQNQIQDSLDSLRSIYEQAKLLEPYFPLSRWGQFQVYATKASEPQPVFAAFENEPDQLAAIAQLKKEGWTVKVGYDIREALTNNPPADSFLAKMYGMVDQIVASDSEAKALKEEFYQLYLRSLPELSARKHFLHRKGIPGFSADALRGFAHLANSRANAIARLRHSDVLTDTLTDMERTLRRLGRDPAMAQTINRAGMIVQELQDSYEWMMNPNNATWANRLTSFGFLWHLTNPSTALVNLTQVPIMTFPDLAAKFDAGSAFSALTRTVKDYGSWKFSGSVEKEKAQKRLYAEYAGDLGRMLQSPKIFSQISRTEAVALAGMSDDAPEYKGGVQGTMASLYQSALYYGGWLYRKAEIANREVTAIAAYRLARDRAAPKVARGEITAEQAHQEASDIAYNSLTRTQGDFSLSNRAWFLRGNAMRVMFLFRSFSHMMTWNILRDAYQAVKGETKDARQLARRRLGWLGVTSLVFGGATGFPLYSVIAMAANALFGSDPDDPYDFDTEVKSLLTRAGGETFARTILQGPVGQAPRILNLLGLDLHGADLSPRVSLDLARLWVRREPVDIEGGAAMDWWMAQFAGPLYGTVRGAAESLRLLGQTSHDPEAWYRTLEGLTPAPIRNLTKSMRYEMQGVTTRRGDLLMDDFGWSDLITQAVGFAPDVLADRYRENTKLYELKYAIESRRKNLTTRYIFAKEHEDPKLIEETLTLVEKYNRLNPEHPITGDTLRAAYKKYLRARREQESGVYIPSEGLRARVFRDLHAGEG